MTTKARWRRKACRLVRHDLKCTTSY